MLLDYSALETLTARHGLNAQKQVGVIQAVQTWLIQATRLRPEPGIYFLRAPTVQIEKLLLAHMEAAADVWCSRQRQPPLPNYTPKELEGEKVDYSSLIEALVKEGMKRQEAEVACDAWLMLGDSDWETLGITAQVGQLETCLNRLAREDREVQGNYVGLWNQHRFRRYLSSQSGPYPKDPVFAAAALARFLAFMQRHAATIWERERVPSDEVVLKVWKALAHCPAIYRSFWEREHGVPASHGSPLPKLPSQ